MKSYNALIILVLVIFMSCFVSSQDDTSQMLGTFQQNSPVEIIQICSNSTSLCDLCNITSIKYPNSSIIISNIEMTKRPSDFNYTLDGNITNLIGSYLVNGYCQAGSEVSVWSYTFLITPTGQEKPNTGEGLSLIGIMGIITLVAGFFLLMAWMSNNQVVKSMFVGLSAFIMAVIVFFGMVTITQILGGFSNLVTGYNTFFFFILLCIVIAVFAIIIIVFINSLYQLKVRRGALEPRNFQLDGEMR